MLKAKKIHFIGIGGIGMSALAVILAKNGYCVSGSDSNESKTVDHLRANDIQIHLGQKKEHIASDLDLVVISLAIAENNEELIEARNKNIEILTYPQALGIFLEKFKLISVCGTHGKSTSTAMLTDVFVNASLDPNIIIGTKLKTLNGANHRVGGSNYFLLESCEYKEAFLNYKPFALLITNIDPDHLDYYKTEENYIKAFEKYIENVREGGVLVINGDDVNCKKVLRAQNSEFSKRSLKIITFGEDENNDYVLKGAGIYKNEEKIANLNLKVPGHHNRMNACGAFALAESLGVDRKIILDSLNNFAGSWRRLEFKGEMSTGALVYDDYGHHPTEIKATIEAIRELYPKNNLIVVFQPHQHSRTKFLLEGFAKAFDNTDMVIIPNIYQVRDSHGDVQSISAESLVGEISQFHKDARFGDGFVNTVELLKKESKEGDVVLIMGAGDIEKLSTMIF